MSLRERILVILFVMFGCYMATEYAVHRWLIYPEYIRQEQQQAQTAVQHAVDAIDAELETFQRQIAHAAQSGAFCVRDHNITRLRSTEPPNEADFLLLFDHHWQRQWDNLQDPSTAALLENQLLKTDVPFIQPTQAGFSIQDYYPVNGRFAWVVAEPILSASSSRTVEGTVIAGRFLDDQHLQTMKDRMGLRFTWQLYSPDAAKTQAAAPEPYQFSSIGDSLLQCTTTLCNNARQPVLAIKTTQNRDISNRGLQTIYKWMLVKLVAGISAVLLLTVLLQRAIVFPIMKLIKRISKVEDAAASPHKDSTPDRNELSRLGFEFDRMCSRVQNARIKLAEKSYHSGITEMSSGILHNVRNALSPITTRIERIKGQFRDLPLEHLEQAQQELQEGALSPQRRTDLIRFVELTFQNVVDNLKDTVTGLDDLSRQVIQIEDMLNSQKTFGGKDIVGSVEYQEPLQLINKALEMVPEETRRLCKVETKSIETLAAIPVPTATFTQVLQNLVVNAGESLQRQKTLCPKITVTCTLEAAEPVDQLHWQVRDNGTGIARDKLKQIFERGASSKKTGLTGIGLHWCANTITAMRGHIWAESDGPHQGACFHVVIPAAVEEALACVQEGSYEG